MPPHTLDVFFIGADAPDWSDEPGLRVVRVDPTSVADLLEPLARDVPFVTVIDGDLGTDDGNEELVDIARGLGPVVFACTSSTAGGPAGRTPAVPRRLLDGPGVLAREVLMDFAGGSTGPDLDSAPDRAPDPAFERFLRDALHEFRTPLTVIVEFASLCTEGIGGPLTDQQRGYLEHVIRAAGRLEEQFDDFRETALLGTRTPGETPATDRATALSAVAEAVSSRGARLAPVPSGGWGSLAVDADLLTRVVTRVLDCAAKWSRGDEPLCTSVEEDPEDARRVHVVVEYAGISPTAEDAMLLVDPPAVPEGSPYRSVARVFGLGIAMATSSLACCGGQISLEPAEDGRGGRFVIQLPTGTDRAALAA